jgi:hypothetical protein
MRAQSRGVETESDEAVKRNHRGGRRGAQKTAVCHFLLPSRPRLTFARDSAYSPLEEARSCADTICGATTRSGRTGG